MMNRKTAALPAPNPKQASKQEIMSPPSSFFPQKSSQKMRSGWVISFHIHFAQKPQLESQDPKFPLRPPSGPISAKFINCAKSWWYVWKSLENLALAHFHLIRKADWPTKHFQFDCFRLRREAIGISSSILTTDELCNDKNSFSVLVRPHCRIDQIDLPLNSRMVISPKKNLQA